jgi:EAL and modified HD-GYP domain-containing signal transduction protein
MNEQELEPSRESLLRRLNDPTTSLTELAQMIEPNEVLSGRIIERANSALFGTRRQVTSLKQAVLLIGFRNARNILAEMEEEKRRQKQTEKEMEAEM